MTEFLQKNVAVKFGNFRTVLWKLRNFTATAFSQEFRQTVITFTKYFANCAVCTHTRNLLSYIYMYFFDKNFVKTTFLLKKLLNSWFDEKTFGESEFLNLVSLTVLDFFFVKSTIYLFRSFSRIFSEKCERKASQYESSYSATNSQIDLTTGEIAFLFIKNKIFFILRKKVQVRQGRDYSFIEHCLFKH